MSHFIFINNIFLLKIPKICIKFFQASNNFFFLNKSLLSFYFYEIFNYENTNLSIWNILIKLKFTFPCDDIIWIFHLGIGIAYE